jgi:hypothetical protein
MSVVQRASGTDYGRYSLYVYPEWKDSLDRLSGMFELGGPSDVGVKMASYHSRDYDEASLKRLYQLIETRNLNVDSVFDDILSDS